MPADRWNEALEAAAKVCEEKAAGWAPYDDGYISDELRECKQAILALREADQRGAAATCTEGASPETGESQNRASDGKLEAQSAPHHPGGQPVAWTTVLSLELAKGAFYASPVNLWAEKGIPIYTHPGGQEKADGKVEGDGKPAPASPGPMVPKWFEALLLDWEQTDRHIDSQYAAMQVRAAIAAARGEQ